MDGFDTALLSIVSGRHPCLLPSGGRTGKMLGAKEWERPEHNDRNPIKRILIIMLALQAFWL